jgi:hypothetical protein
VRKASWLLLRSKGNIQCHVGVLSPSTIESQSQGQCLALTAWRASPGSRQDVKGTGAVAEKEMES